MNKKTSKSLIYDDSNDIETDATDFYSDREIEALLEDDEITVEENGFMQGYLWDEDETES